MGGMLVSREFWLMTIVFLVFIAFASVMTYWGGYEPFTLFWLISGVIGVASLVYFSRRDASRQG